MESYRELLVWQKSMSLVTQIYKNTRGFPKEELYGLVTQIRRYAISIPSNIAEGWGRSATQDYLRFLRISRGSMYELQTQLDVCGNIGYINSGDLEGLYPVCDEIGKMLNGLITKLKTRI